MGEAYERLRSVAAELGVGVVVIEDDGEGGTAMRVYADEGTSQRVRDDAQGLFELLRMAGGEEPARTTEGSDG